MKPQPIESIPIAEIRVVNPRSRNRTKFREIVKNIGAVGLKKPILVVRRELEADGTRYDLVCGQGRLEALAALGATEIPAMITTASAANRYLMSLVENIARKQPPHRDLLIEVRELQKRGYTKKEISAKLGMGRAYIEGVLRLLRSGETDLVEKVASGTVPLTIAVQIATAGGDAVQNAMMEAYEKGELRGGKLRVVQRLIASRFARQRPENEKALDLSRQELAQTYEQHTARQRDLIRKADSVEECLAILTAAMKQLFADAAFVNLLRREGLDTMPEPLATRIR
jgi:ParB family transcriptional regulator, chromosome partitioning protein